MVTGIVDTTSAKKALEELGGLPVIVFATYPANRNDKFAIVVDDEQYFDNGINSAIEMSPLHECSMEKVISMSTP